MGSKLTEEGREEEEEEETQHARGTVKKQTNKNKKHLTQSTHIHTHVTT
jgi:hypothetical protein